MVASSQNHLIDVGKVIGTFGIKGLLKIFSYTNPPEQIGIYSPWIIGDDDCHTVIKTAMHNRILLAELADIRDRTSAETLCQRKIRVTKQQLYDASDSGHYWFQLIGMRVLNQQSRELGTVERLLATGANDVLVVTAAELPDTENKAKTHLIPYVMEEYIQRIDVDQQCIFVKWHEDW